MVKILNISAECFPAAKVGGLADVVGSLPKYLQRMGVGAAVIIPKYRTTWISDQKFDLLYEDEIQMGGLHIAFSIQKERQNKLGFPFYVVDLPAYFDREGLYGDPGSAWGYSDEAQRFISFQLAALSWIQSRTDKPDIIHCHDHHAGLIPFMMTQCSIFKSLASIPTVLTVHNAEYQGRYSHGKVNLLPDFDENRIGLLDWNWQLNSLAAGLKCCWQISTVSPSYMRELCYKSNGLELLFSSEKQKSRGILNGIDTTVWNPETDTHLLNHYSNKTLTEGKSANKQLLCKTFNFEEKRPLISFIGRLVNEKGADLLPKLFESILKNNDNVNFLVLGTGHPELHTKLNEISDEWVGFFDASLSYNEQLAHQIYAGSDFMIMPSRVEPCGLNQMYAMRYGTIPIVRNVGGLKDTVHDINEDSGYGITFDELNLRAARKAVYRALKLFSNEKEFHSIRKKIMALDFSWNVSARAYINMYKQLINPL